MTSQLMNAKEELETLPDNDELNRLVEYYETYEWEHRFLLLNGYFLGKTVKEMVLDKLKAKDIDPSTCSPQSLGGHSRWVKSKVKKAIVRLLYVRYRLDDGMSKKEANQELLKRYPSIKEGTKDVVNRQYAR